ncbi:MAG: nuclear transport factor 2 family protein [Deltaproteobacteria bacterium]|nr:nuclear transport factor 2 family protein [Deltaproteobacteria bacterium]
MRQRLPGATILALLACRSEPAARPPRPARPAATATADTGGAPAAPAVVSEAAVRAFLDGWLAAQNQGDFERYRALYAARFSGVKRVGPRRASYDHDQWMVDRQRMFRDAMRVAATDVAVSAGVQGAELRFTQDFTSGAFHDQGPKHLSLVLEGSALRIAREEMLRSELGGGAGEPAQIAPGGFFPVLDHHAPWVVLSTRPEAGWSRGAPTLVDQGQVVATRQEAVASALPPALSALQGRQVVLYTDQGRACAGTLGAPSVLRRVDVHFGTEQRWNGEEGAPRATPAEIAQEAWGLGEGGALLVAPVDSRQGSCDGARWARAADAGEGVVFVQRPAPAALAAAALARARALPAWARLQRDYVAEVQGPAGRRWDEHGGQRPAVALWQAGAAGRSFVTVRSSVAVGGCGEYAGALTVVLESVGPTLVLQSDPEDPGSFEPLAATDADGDGAVDFLTTAGVWRRRGTVLRLVESLAHPMLDCDC